MEMAKVTSKGQITIPISIRRRLGINEGDKILFVNRKDGVLMLNPDNVQGDVADYVADDIPLDAAVPAAPPAAPPAAAAKTAKPAPHAEPAASAPSGSIPSGAVADEIEPPRRKYIPPVDEPEPKPAQAGGINLSTLLDDIRSIGSNI